MLWDGLTRSEDRAAVAVLEEELGAANLAEVVRRIASDRASAPWERQMDLALELESVWDDYMARELAAHGLPEPPPWVEAPNFHVLAGRILAYVSDRRIGAPPIEEPARGRGSAVSELLRGLWSSRPPAD